MANTSIAKAVFVETSLKTHLVMTLSLSDTVADFKKKIKLEHEKSFPEFGAWTVHSLKVEYRGELYLVLESVTVLSRIFEGYGGRWYIFVDASSTQNPSDSPSSSSSEELLSQGKRDAEEVIEKEVSKKKQKKDVVNGKAAGAAKNGPMSPPKKKLESSEESSSEEDSDSESDDSSSDDGFV